MGPEAIRETLSAEGLSEPAIDLGLAALATASDIRSPLSFARHVATNDYSPTKAAMGCSACIDGWLRNPDTGDEFFTKTYRGSFRVSATDPSLGTETRDIETEFVRPCRTCKPQHYERRAG